MEEKQNNLGVNDLCQNDCKTCKYFKCNFCALVVYFKSDIDIMMDIEEEIKEIYDKYNNKNR